MESLSIRDSMTLSSSTLERLGEGPSPVPVVLLAAVDSLRTAHLELEFAERKRVRLHAAYCGALGRQRKAEAELDEALDFLCTEVLRVAGMPTCGEASPFPLHAEGLRQVGVADKARMTETMLDAMIAVDMPASIARLVEACRRRLVVLDVAMAAARAIETQYDRVILRGDAAHADWREAFVRLERRAAIVWSDDSLEWDRVFGTSSATTDVVFETEFLFDTERPSGVRAIDVAFLEQAAE